MFSKLLKHVVVGLYVCSTLVGENVPTSTPTATPNIRIKDLAHFTAVRDNPLVGYGLVVGLNNTGDTMSRSTFTRESLTGMLERLGVNIRDGEVPSGKNVAAVMVTANLSPFARPGTRLDITVSALGDAKELRGGMLLVTPLLGADGNVYAVGQGAVLAAGIQASGKASKEIRGVPTCARVANGAIVERAMGFELTSLKDLTLTLHNPDFTTAQRVAEAVNKAFHTPIATALDASSVHIRIPPERATNLVELMVEIEQITVKPDITARVIIDSNNDVVTLTSMAKVLPVALTHGSITIKVVETPNVFMPPPNTANPAGNIVVTPQQQANTSNNGTSVASSSMPDSIVTLLGNLVEQQSKERQNLYNVQVQAVHDAQKNGQSIIKINALKAEQTKQTAQLQTQQEAALKAVAGNTSNPANPNSANQQNTGKPSVTAESYSVGSHAYAAPAGSAIVTDSTDVKLKDEVGKFAVIQSGADLQEFINALNSLGATPKDMMAILQNIKAAGALQADIILT